MRFVPRVLAVLFLLTCFANTGAVGLAQGDCFSHPVAYLAGVMNIRESPTTGSNIVGQTNAGDRFDVLDTAQSRSWCWIKIGTGWIAKTTIVTGKGQPSTTTLSQPPDCTNDDYLAYTNVLNEITGELSDRIGELTRATQVAGFAHLFFEWRDGMWANLSHCDPLYPIRDDFIVITTDILIALSLQFAGIPIGSNSYARDYRERWESMFDYADKVIANMS